MSLSYSPESIIGGNIDEKVHKQLKSRQDLFSNTNNFRTDETLQYLNASTGWIRVCSSVDTKGIDDTYSSKLAQQNVLLGGTLLNNTTKRDGLFSFTEGASSYDNGILGYRPMAGITGFTVTSKGFAGSIRTAALEFQANSIEQLSALEQIYLRPGFTVFIEWGHSMYVDNSKTINKQPDYVTDYFSYTDREQVITAAEKIKNNSGYNYNYMYAYVSNFTWTYNTSGGYDCRIETVSAGDLVESLSIAISGGSAVKTDLDVSKSLSQQTSALHRFLYAINNADTEKYFKEEDFNTTVDNPDLRRQCLETALTRYCEPLWSDLKSKLAENNIEFDILRVQVGINPKTGSWFRYIPLGVLLEIINLTFIPTNQNDKPLFRFNTSNETKKKSKFTTFDQHFCVDPSVAALPKDKKSLSANTNFRLQFVEQAKFNGSQDDILNIYINIDFVLSLLGSILERDKISDKTIYDFIAGILSKLNSNLGNINNFDLHYEEQENTYYIVDTTVLPSAEQMTDSRSRINVVGLNSTVENINLSSTVPNSLTAVVAAAASAETTDVRNELHAMFRWNTGLKDRTNTVLKFSSDNKALYESQEFHDELVLLAKYVVSLNQSNFIMQYIPEDIAGIRLVFNKTMSIFKEYYTNSKTNSSGKYLNAPGLIPIKLELTLKGISGLKMGQCFTINDEIIPEKYRGKVAFQIWHLADTIVNNKWITDVGALMFSLDVKDIPSNEITKIPTIKNIKGLEDEFGKLVEVLREDLPGVLFRKPIPVLTERNDYPGGEGKFLALRERAGGVTPTHFGWDVLADPGTQVKSPIEGTVSKSATWGPKGHPALKITGTGIYKGIEVTLGYTDWSKVNSLQGDFDVLLPRLIFEGIKVQPGQPIGQVIDLQVKPQGADSSAYGKNISNHIHIAVKYNQQVQDPSKLAWQ